MVGRGGIYGNFYGDGREVNPVRSLNEGDVVASQLADGNMGAMAYFTKRVELMLNPSNEKNAADLHLFLSKWWPHFKAGLDKLQREKDAA